jgi:ABC-type transport system substrate-binding protein
MKPTCIRQLAIVWMLTLAGILNIGAGNVQAAPPAGVLKQAIHWGLSADWLDPATCGYSGSAHIAMYLLHDGLVKTMPEGLFTPSLAESWKVSPDAKTYEFKLRKGVKFHNGEIITPEDVIFSFLRYKGTNAKFLRDQTEGVEAVGSDIVRFRFKGPFPDFLEYLIIGASTAGWVVPKKYVEKVGDAGFKKHPIGAGPYKFVEFVAGVRLVAEAFDDYWRKTPHIKRIELHPRSSHPSVYGQKGRDGYRDPHARGFLRGLEEESESANVGSAKPDPLDGQHYLPVGPEVTMVGSAGPAGGQPGHRPQDLG